MIGNDVLGGVGVGRGDWGDKKKKIHLMLWRGHFLVCIIFGGWIGRHTIG